MTDSRETVFDPIRKLRVALTPEERVRQSVVYYLTSQLRYPPELLANEATITVGKVLRRCDTAVFHPETRMPLMVLEYKAPTVPITDITLRQILEYNSVLGAKVLVVTNGKTMSVLRVTESGEAGYLDEIPPFDQLLSDEI